MKSKLLVITISVLLLAAIVPVTRVFAATTWYVDDSGGADFTTINAAVAVAVAGDTIIVKDGTYIENMVVDKSLTIQSENGAISTTVIAVVSTTPVFNVDASGVVIDGFSVLGPTDTHVAGIELVSVNNCLIQNNDCSGGCYNGIHLGGTSTNNTVKGNYCHGNTMRGISVRDSANGNFISENTVENNAADGFCIKDTTKNNVLWLNNIIGTVEILTANTYNSLAPLNYTYNGGTYTGYLGNYWDTYTGSDVDGDGVGDTPHNFGGTSNDLYPLMERSENYPLTEEELPTTSASLNVTANIGMAMVGIELNRDSIDYGNVAPGESSAVETVGITNIGTVGVDVSLEVQGADATAQSFYEQSLYIDGAKYNMTTVIASIPVEGSEDVDTQLQVPLSWAEPGVQDATFIFWAEASP